MSDGALRGTRLGATSYETDNHVELAPRQPVSYDCPNGHVTTMPFSLEAEVPLVWECRCGAEALLRDGDRPEPKVAKHVRTPVSYKHLDVYKRQGYQGACTWLGKPAEQAIPILLVAQGTRPRR